MNFKKQEMQIKEIKNIPVDKEVQIVIRLAKELIEISRIKKEKYSLREECLDRLIKKMETSSSKFLIDLDDLPNHFILKFNNHGKNILKDLSNFMKERYGLDRVNRKYGVNFYLINESINKGYEGLRVDTLRKYIKFLSNQKINIFDVNIIKKNVVQLKPSIKSKYININGLPFDLRDEKWALIFGIILDTNMKTFTIFAEDKDFAHEIVSTFNEVGIEPYVKNLGNLVKIKGHSIIGHIVNIGGIEVNYKQLIANNFLPLWMFSCSRKYHSILLSKFLDTEGYVPNSLSGIRIAQASLIKLTKEERGFILLNCKVNIISSSNKESKVVIFSKLDENLKEKVLSNPSLILIGIQLLLRKYGINAKIYPVNVYISSNGIASISWHLAIFGFDNIRLFYDLCGKYISIKYKRDNIKKILNGQKLSCLPRGLRIAYYLFNAVEIQNSKGFFTTKDLIERTKKNKKTVYDTVGYLAQLNMINVIKKNNRIKLWNITERGIKKLNDTCQDTEKWNYLFK
tara:strand:- start:5094 stop:6635 length:1542 start_codon:yes stop_codon:yes gene_type:complete